MRHPLTILVGAATLCACTAAAPTPAPTASAEASAACFRTRDITNHRIVNDNTVYIQVARRDVFRLEMVGHCLAGTGGSDPLVIRTRAGSTLACRPVDLDISVARGVGTTGNLRSSARTPCIVQSMTRLTPDQVAALPSRSRP